MTKKAIAYIKQQKWKNEAKGVTAIKVVDSKVDNKVKDRPLHEACLEMLWWSNMNAGQDDDDVFGNDVAEFGFIEVSSKRTDTIPVIFNSGVVMYSSTNLQVGTIDCTQTQ